MTNTFVRRVVASILLGLLTAVGSASTRLRAQDVIISELMAVNDSTLADEDLEYSDWIELYNPGPAEANLAGWHLTDLKENLKKWTFPDATLGAGRFLVVFASEKDRARAGWYRPGKRLGSPHLTNPTAKLPRNQT